jgi:hypothetical protein
MKSQITITTLGDTLRIASPFSETNNKVYRSKGGKFDRENGSWVFANTDATREMIANLWGATSPLVRAKIDFTQIVTGMEWQVGGYKLAHRRDRDGPVEMAPGVRIESGAWRPSGGSRNCPMPACIADEITLSVIVFRSYAEANDLEIIDEDRGEDAEIDSALSGFSDEEIFREAKRRGVQL